jgi:hypothetical protein
MTCSRIGLLMSLVIGIVVSAAVVLAPACAFAAGPGVAWQVTQVSRPTNLIPGSSNSSKEGSAPELDLIIRDVGAAVSEGGVTITDTLPSGLTPTEAGFKYKPSVGQGLPNAEQGPCTLAGQEVTCVISKTIFAGSTVRIFVAVAVDAGLTGEVAGEVRVEGGGVAMTSHPPTTIAAAQAPFSFLDPPGVFAGVSDQAGGIPSAGSHPYLLQFNLDIATDTDLIPGTYEPSGDLRRVALELPQGLVLNPTAVETCPLQILTTAGAGEPPRECPPAAQIGEATVSFAGLPYGVVPLYELVPPPGAPAAFGFSLEGLTVVVQGGLLGNFHLTGGSSELLKKFRVSDIGLNFWGVPYDASHNFARNGGEVGGPENCNEVGGCHIEAPAVPLVTMPTSCNESTTARATAESWSGQKIEKTVPLMNRELHAIQIAGCSELSFRPTISSQATTVSAESPSGLDFSIHQPQEESPEGRATAALKDATVTLPEGMSLNPAAANGLAACSEEQMGYAPEEGKIRFATTPQICPDAAKVGTLSVHTPLLDEDQPGAIYVAKPFDNPFGSLLAIYLAVEDETTGIVAKLAGKVTPNPVTGQLQATFAENPELPLEDIDLHFFPGARGVLTTPLTCGPQTTTSTLTPWSTPEGADAHPSDSFGISTGCSPSEAAAPKTTTFTAGTQSPISGAYSPFVLRLSRPDGSQHITGIETTLPEGLLGKLAGVAYCPEVGIARAISRERPEMGKAEQAEPSCPASSEVGTVQVTAGSGSAPIPVSGHAYLAGPYKGAPLSLVVIVPAVAGPFDLGTVVDRVALNVDEYTARIHAVADPLPTIREGIPLNARSIELRLDRPSFTLNPTSCEAMAIEGTATTQAGQSEPLSNRFQVGECGRLKFKPNLSLKLSGATGRTGHPALKATVTYPNKGTYANIARAQVSLPHAEFLHQAAIADACTKPLLAARACPKKSIYGKARAWSPLLDKPLEGPVYLVGGYGYKLPAMVAELNGQIRFLLVGKIDTGKSGGIRNTFEVVPDAPVSRFVLQIRGGKHGLLENSEDLCEKPRKAGVAFTAQNGRSLRLTPRISNNCGGGSKAKKGSK